jgi:hypothetical protein
MILSVVIPFCDNDYQFLNGAVSSIKEHIKFDDYEIIVVDNREKEKSTINIEGVKIISAGSNLKCFEGRRLGVQNSQGKFIWNFDVDDKMIGDIFIEDIKEDADVIQMFYIYNNGIRFDKKMFPFAYGFNVWSRLYKADIVKDFYSKLERPIRVLMREDKLLFDAVCKSAHYWKYIPRVIYEYNYKNATYNINNKKDKPPQEIIDETFDCYKYVYDILGEPKKADILIERVKQIIERGY